jgi:hypothetical protein
MQALATQAPFKLIIRNQYVKSKAPTPPLDYDAFVIEMLEAGKKRLTEKSSP